MTIQKYKKYTEAHAKKSPLLLHCVKAFIAGGTICALGQGLVTLFEYLGFAETSARMLETQSLIVLSALITCLGLYNNLAKHAGAGTLVPITGFANAIVSPAMDNKHEGMILGVGAKMFVVAGPVIIYGTCASVIYGIIYFALKQFNLL